MKILGTKTQAMVEESLMRESQQSPIEIPEDLVLMGNSGAGSYGNELGGGKPRAGGRKSVLQQNSASSNNEFDTDFFNEFAPNDENRQSITEEQK